MTNQFTLNSAGRSPASRRAESRVRSTQRRQYATPRSPLFEALGSPEKSHLSTEDISFYAGNSPQCSPRPCSISPCMEMGLLSPETSHSHFTISVANADPASHCIEERTFSDIDYNSMDSGYDRTNDSTAVSDSRTCFKFVEPSGVAPKRHDSISPPKTSSIIGAAAKISPPKSISCFRPFNSLSSDSMDSMDDEYMTLLDMETVEDDFPSLPAHFNTIISGDIKSAPELLKRPTIRRCLSMMTTDSHVNCLPTTPEDHRKSETFTQSLTPYSSRTSISTSDNITPRGFKRPDSSLQSPVLSKRPKCDSNSSTSDKENAISFSNGSEQQPLAVLMSRSPVARPVFRKSMSMNDAKIMSALARCKLYNRNAIVTDQAD